MRHSFMLLLYHLQVLFPQIIFKLTFQVFPKSSVHQGSLYALTTFWIMKIEPITYKYTTASLENILEDNNECTVSRTFTDKKILPILNTHWSTQRIRYKVCFIRINTCQTYGFILINESVHILNFLFEMQLKNICRRK